MVLLMAAVPLSTYAHLIGDSDREALPELWHFDPLALLLLALVAFWYWRGSRILAQRRLANRTLFRRRQFGFWLGWFTLLIALGSPLDVLGEWLFSVHMVQHELIMLVSGPLLVLSRPASALLTGMGRKTASVLMSGLGTLGLSRCRGFLLAPASAWVIHAVGLWGWHIPALFNASLNNTWVHTLQHISFLAIALIFWYSLVHIQNSRSVVGMVYLFSTAVHASLLGALLTFSPRVWYSPYLETTTHFGLTALQDQQLGGLIMWMPAGVVFIAGALWLLARAISDPARRHYHADASHE